MVTEAKAEKKNLDRARAQYQQRANIRDERKLRLNNIKSQIEKLRIIDAGSSILEKKPQAVKTLATTLLIEVSENGEKKGHRCDRPPN